MKLSIPWAGEFPDVKLCQMHGEVEQAVEDAGLQMTSLRPFAFMQNTFGDAATVQQGQLFNPLPPEARLPLADARDIADCTVAALQNKTTGAFWRQHERDVHEAAVRRKDSALTPPEASAAPCLANVNAGSSIARGAKGLGLPGHSMFFWKETMRLPP